MTTEKSEDITEKKKSKFVIVEGSPDDPIYKLGFVIAKSLSGRLDEARPVSVAEEGQD